MATPLHVRTHRGTFEGTVREDGGTRSIEIAYVLTVDLDSLVRQLAASALVSESNPKQASRAHGAVELTITEEVRAEL